MKNFPNHELTCRVCPCSCNHESSARCRAHQIYIVHGSRNPGRGGRENGVWKRWCKRLKSALKNGSFRGFHGYIRFSTTRYVVAIVVSPTDSVSFLEQGNYDSGKRSPRGLNVCLISSCCEISSLLMISERSKFWYNISTSVDCNYGL